MKKTPCQLKKRTLKGLRLSVLYNSRGSPREQALLKALKERGEREGLGLLCFDTACLAENPLEASLNQYCNLITKKTCDGLLALDPNLLAMRFPFRLFSPLPLVTIGFKAKGFPSVLTALKDTLDSVLRHFREIHHCLRPTLLINDTDANEKKKSEETKKIQQKYQCKTYGVSELWGLGKDHLKELLSDFDLLIFESPNTAEILGPNLFPICSGHTAPFVVILANACQPLSLPANFSLTLYPAPELVSAALRLIEEELDPQALWPAPKRTISLSQNLACFCQRPEMPTSLRLLKEEPWPSLALSHKLLTTTDRSRLIESLTVLIKELGIADCYLAFKEDHSRPLQYIKLALAIRNSALLDPGQSEPYLANRLLPPVLFPSRPFTLTIEPIFVENDFEALLILSLPPHLEGQAYELQRLLHKTLSAFTASQDEDKKLKRLKNEISFLTHKLLETQQKLQKEKRHSEGLARALLYKEEEYKRWFEDDFTGNFIADASGRIIACNSSFAKIFGFSSAAEAIGANFGDLYPHASALEDFYTMLQVVRRIEYYETEFVRRDGSVIHVIGNIIGIFDNQNYLKEMYGFLFDNTERKRLEEELRHSHKMDAIGRLSGGIAHDFNNILTGIMGYAELLLNKIPKSDPSQREVEQIKKAAKSAASLTRQLLAFSRKQIMRPLVLDLNEVVRNMRDMLVRIIGEHINLAIELDPELGPVKADRGQIEQVIMNLILNARDALPEGGHITIATRNFELKGPASKPELHELKAGHYVILEVRDDGLGMDFETQAHIFEPFFTTKKVGHGVGLGLSTVYGIISQSGGVIEVISAPQSGTTMRIYLPRYTRHLAVEEESLSFEEPVHGNQTILLVEDEDIVRETTSKILAQEGYHVLTAHNASEALSLLKKRSLAFDLILTDIVMPGMSGIELAHKVKALRPGLKVLLMSGYDEKLLSELGKNPLMNNFIAKPFSPALLLRKIADTLSG